MSVQTNWNAEADKVVAAVDAGKHIVDDLWCFTPNHSPLFGDITGRHECFTLFKSFNAGQPLDRLEPILQDLMKDDRIPNGIPYCLVGKRGPELREALQGFVEFRERFDVN